MHRRITKSTTLLVMFFVLPSFAYAAPNVSGVSSVLSHGNTITITGNSFGTKPTGAPLLWKNFEDRPVGVSVKGNDGWQVQSTAADIKYTDEFSRHSNSSISVKDHFDYSAGIKGNFQRAPFSDVKGKKLLSFWWRIDPIQNTTATNNNSQLKAFRIAAGPNHADFPTLELDTTWLNDGSNGQNVFALYSTTGKSWWGFKPRLKRWTRVTMLIEDSDFNVSNGKWRVWHFAGDTKQEYSTDASPMQTTKYPGFMKWISLGYTTVNAPNYIVNTYWDDIYADDSWARIEICNDSTYDAATLCEIQIPQHWTPTSISAQVNKGSFPNGSAYLYVFDATGAVSNGLPITIGAGSGTTDPDTTSPAAPTGLRVQ